MAAGGRRGAAAWLAGALCAAAAAAGAGQGSPPACDPRGPRADCGAPCARSRDARPPIRSPKVALSDRLLRLPCVSSEPWRRFSRRCLVPAGDGVTSISVQGVLSLTVFGAAFRPQAITVSRRPNVRREGAAGSRPGRRPSPSRRPIASTPTPAPAPTG